jgi:outer membrane usher protein
MLNNNGDQLSGSGYGVVASLMPYRQNEVALDPKGIADDVELQLTSQSIAPRYGAVVMLNYPTVTGEPVLLTLHNEQRQALPMGAEVLDAQGNSLTLVGQGSRVFFRATEPQGQLTVRWGQSSDRQCLVHYSLPSLEHKRESPFIKAQALCSKPSGAPKPRSVHEVSS